MVDGCHECARILAPQGRHVALAQRLAGYALSMTILGTVTLGLGLGLLGAEMHSTSFAPFLSLLLGLSALLVAPMLGAGALIARRGTNAPHVVGRAVLALCVGVGAALFSLLVALGLSGFSP